MTFDDLIAKYDEATDACKKAKGAYDPNDSSKLRTKVINDIVGKQRLVDQVGEQIMTLIMTLPDRDTALIQGDRVFVVLNDRDGDLVFGVFKAIPSSTEIPHAQ